VVRVLRLGALVLIGVVVHACGQIPVDPRPALGIDNGTTLPVTIVVNGTEIETVPPTTHRLIEPEALPEMPWEVEARTPTGRVLLTLAVAPGVVSKTVEPDGVVSLQGAADRVDLSCGRLDLYAGPPLIGPMLGPGEPGDCEP